MKTTCEFLDAIKTRHGIASDYALAKRLCKTQQAISNYRVKRTYCDDLTAFKIAELLEIDPALVIACANAERAKSAQDKALWESILEKLGGVAAMLALGIGLAGAPAPAQAAGGNLSVSNNGTFYTLCVNRRRRKRASPSPFSLALGNLIPLQQH